jgi:hypothetical protein
MTYLPQVAKDDDLDRLSRENDAWFAEVRRRNLEELKLAEKRYGDASP